MSARTQAANIAPANIPVVDFKAIRASTGDKRKKHLRQLDDARSSHGHLRWNSGHTGSIFLGKPINNSGYEVSIGGLLLQFKLSELQSKKLFSLPLRVKNSIHIPPDSATNFQGWTGVGDAISFQGVWDPEEIERLRKEQSTGLKEAMKLWDPNGMWPEGAADLALVEEHLPGYIDFARKW